jgi:hypothetical protein
MSAAEPKLRPCICGGEAKLTCDSICYRVKCSKCGASVERYCLLILNKEETLEMQNTVIKEWNQRANEQHVD